jgi:hypothetical protein
MGRAIIVANIVLAFAFCNWNDTATGIDLNKLPRFPLSLIAKRILTKFGRTNFSGITVADTPEEVRVSGRAKSGKAWEVHLCSTCDEEVWRGDLDGNGTPDNSSSALDPSVMAAPRRLTRSTFYSWTSRVSLSRFLLLFITAKMATE